MTSVLPKSSRRTLPSPRSLAPVLAPQARVVILGSMPGHLSLKCDQYYAHPQNRFWPIMHELFGIGLELSYAKRLELLTQAGVGRTEVPNDFRLLFDRCPAVRALFSTVRKRRRRFVAM